MSYLVKIRRSPGKFVFLREIKGGYRVCTGVASRSRSANDDFNEKMFDADSSGFEEAVKIAKKYGTMGDYNEDDLRAAFYVCLALCLLHGGEEKYCKKALDVAFDISGSQTLELIDALYCESECKQKMKQMVSS